MTRALTGEWMVIYKKTLLEKYGILATSYIRCHCRRKNGPPEDRNVL